MTKQFDNIWCGATIATMMRGDYGLIKEGVIATKADKIAWVGTVNELKAEFKQMPEQLAHHVHDLTGLTNKVITPGLIDCHTHVVYAGNRYQEFEMRLNGKSYQQIAQAGGGIRSTVKATRVATAEELLAQSLVRVKAMLRQGVTTIEIKSGYGLDCDTEIKMLKVAQKIGELLPVTVCPTFLGAHALPAEFQNRADDYIDLVCEEILPVIAKQKLATAVDAFCETIGFTPAQVEKVFKAASQLNLAIKCHTEQLSNLKGSLLAAKYKAISCDHLEYLQEEGACAMAQAGTVAVLLPGAFYFLRETQSPPIELLRKHQVPIALATDCNPGSSPTTSLLLMLSMACTLWQMTPLEALRGVTVNAAKALGLAATHGSLAQGKQADFVIWDLDHPAELAYHIGQCCAAQIIKAGKIV